MLHGLQSDSVAPRRALLIPQLKLLEWEATMNHSMPHEFLGLATGVLITCVMGCNSTEDAPPSAYSSDAGSNTSVNQSDSGVRSGPGAAAPVGGGMQPGSGSATASATSTIASSATDAATATGAGTSSATVSQTGVGTGIATSTNTFTGFATGTDTFTGIFTGFATSTDSFTGAFTGFATSAAGSTSTGTR